MDISSTFLSYLEICDTEMAQQSWAKVQDDAQRRDQLIESEDVEGYNCFLIASRNGDHHSLEWLLSLNDEKEDDAEEDERNVMRKHKKTGMSPLLICVSNDIRKKVDGMKELTDKEKQSYFRCVQCIFNTVSPKNKDILLKEKDHQKYDSMAWCCRNGNVQTAEYLLSQSSAALRRDQMSHYEHGLEYFIEAIRGRNVDLIRLIHSEYERAIENSKEVLDLREKAAGLTAQKQVILEMQSEREEQDGDKTSTEAEEKGAVLQNEVNAARTTLSIKVERDLLRGTKALSVALHCGVMEVAEWILIDLIDDSKKRMKYLNETIIRCKTGRKTEQRAQEIINKILENDLDPIHNQIGIDGVRNIFQFLMEHDDIVCVVMIMDKLQNDEKTKKLWFKEVECLQYAADGRPKLLGELLKYLGEYYKPLLDQNVLISAIEKHSVPVVSLLFQHVHDPKTKDKMIETRNMKENALISCVEQNDASLMALVCQHHTNIEPILGDSFRSCLKSGNSKSIGFLLDQTRNKSDLLNGVDDYGRTALMYSLRSGNAQCLELIVDELKADQEMKQQETESVDEKRDEPIDADRDDSVDAIHPMYEMVDAKDDNILHYLFSDPDRSANNKQINVLKNVLSSDRVRWLLNQRNLSDEHPLHRLNPSTVVSVMEWILDLYDDPLERFKMVANCCWERTKFGHSEYDAYSSKTRIIREFFGEQLVECLEAVKFEKVDMLMLKETFRFTLSWKRPEIQQLILSKISDEKRSELFDSDNLYCSDSIIFDLIRVDHRKIAEVVLPEIVKVNPQMLLALNGERRSAFDVSLSGNRFNIMDLIFESFENSSFLRQYILCDWGAFKQIYRFRKMTKLVEGNIPDEDLDSALFAAAVYDEDMEFTSNILERFSTDKEKGQLLRSRTMWGRTLYALAARSKMRSVMEFLLNDVIKDDGADNVFFYTEPDFAFSTALLHMTDDSLNIDIFERALMSLKPEMRLQQLLWEGSNSDLTEGGSILSRSKTPIFQKKLGELVMGELKNMEYSISDISTNLLQCDGHQGHFEDIDILNQLFNLGMELLDKEYLEIVLSKTPKDLKYKLLVNYEGGWSYNRIRLLMERSNLKNSQIILDLLLKHVENEWLMDALRDVDNPEQHPITVLQMICDQGDTQKFRFMQSIYEKAQIPLDDVLFAIDHEGGSLLHRAMAKSSDISQQIFKAMKSDKMKMMMINQRRRTDGKNLFDIAESTSNKRLLKGVMASIMANVEKNKMKYTEFIPYFQWLIKQKELNSIKAWEKEQCAKIQNPLQKLNCIIICFDIVHCHSIHHSAGNVLFVLFGVLLLMFGVHLFLLFFRQQHRMVLFVNSHCSHQRSDSVIILLFPRFHTELHPQFLLEI